jgi:hypothetical protein
MVWQWVLVSIMAFIAILVLVGVSALAYIYKAYREALMAKDLHERTVVRLYMNEETVNVPAVQTMLDGLTFDEIIGVVGALELAKSMCVSCIPTEPLDEDEQAGAKSLMGDTDDDE